MSSEDVSGAVGILDGKDIGACISVEVETLGAKLALVKMSGLRGQIPDCLQVWRIVSDLKALFLTAIYSLTTSLISIPSSVS
jgi:hypothetical protein